MEYGNSQTIASPATERELVERAIELAERGRGSVSPNPVVGAVLCDSDGRILGEGFHARFGDLHAERVAIEDARGRNEDPRGGTLFVSLEPCSHEGKQPPCTEAILQAGISKVVYAGGDPTDKAAGSGPRMLQEAGVVVEQADDDQVRLAEIRNQPFRKRSQTGLPLVTYKAAMTIDGKVASPAGDSRWISGKESRALVHRMRSECDAVAVGIGTALADDPLLTARSGDGSDRSEQISSDSVQALRVVFDRTARLPLDSALVESVDVAPVVVVAGAGADRSRLADLRSSGVEVIEVAGGDDSVQLLAGLRKLAEDFGISDLLLEGGPNLAGVLFDAGEIDRLLLFIAPTIIGSDDAPSVLAGKGASRIADSTHPITLETTKVGEDLLLDARLREW